MSKLLQDEPVLVTAVVAAGVAYAGSALVAHGVIAPSLMTPLEGAIVPPVAAAFLLAIGVLIRALVTPAAKVRSLLAKAGLFTDTDWSRLDQALDDKLRNLLHLPPADHTVPPETIVADPPDGLNAGHPQGAQVNLVTVVQPAQPAAPAPTPAPTILGADGQPVPAPTLDTPVNVPAAPPAAEGPGTLS